MRCVDASFLLQVSKTFHVPTLGLIPHVGAFASRVAGLALTAFGLSLVFSVCDQLSSLSISLLSWFCFILLPHTLLSSVHKLTQRPFMSRRAPTPLRSAPSSGPMDAMVKNMKQQIDDLVAKNRSLDHTISKLRDSLAEEQKRGSEGVDVLQKTFKQERAAWIRGCDAIQAIHRAAHARTLVELDRERMAVLREREATRIERLARLQRDFRLVEFQRREFDLEKRVVELERELEDLQITYEEEKVDLGEELEGQRATLAAQLQDTADELAATLKAKEDAEVRRAHSRCSYVYSRECQSFALPYVRALGTSRKP